MDRASYPWRHLGELLVDDDVVTPLELERALAEQQRDGRRLGQILVERGALTGAQLARALARQHGVELREADNAQPPAHSPGTELSAAEPWRSLGLLLLQKNLVDPASLQEALAEQRRHPVRRLGEILVQRGLLTPPTLGAVLAEQHGVSVEIALVAGPRVAEARVAPAAPAYEVEVVDEPGSRGYVVHVAPSLLEAADFACDYVDAESPAAIEINRRDGAGRETVWTYSRDEAAAASSKSLVETFGFDPTRWGA
jgi:hypothetical protein